MSRNYQGRIGCERNGNYLLLLFSKVMDCCRDMACHVRARWSDLLLWCLCNMHTRTWQAMSLQQSTTLENNSNREI